LDKRHRRDQATVRLRPRGGTVYGLVEILSKSLSRKAKPIPPGRLNLVEGFWYKHGNLSGSSFRTSRKSCSDNSDKPVV